MNFNSITNLFKRLNYSRFFGPDLASCLDGETSPPKTLLFVRGNNRMPNLNWDFAILYDIMEIEHLADGLCQIRSKAKLYTLDSTVKIAKIITVINSLTQFQVFIVKECFLCSEELLRLNEINLN